MQADGSSGPPTGDEHTMTMPKRQIRVKMNIVSQLAALALLRIGMLYMAHAYERASIASRG